MATLTPPPGPEAGELRSVCPATGEALGSVTTAGAEDVAAAIADAARVQPFWAQVRPAHRARYMLRAAQVIIDELDPLATLLARERGRPRTEAYAAELLPAIDALHWIADHGPRMLGDERIATPQVYLMPKRGRLLREPLGVLGVVAGWDQPWALALEQVAVALMCGNAVVLRPSPQAPLSGARIARVLDRAGLPEGLLHVVHGDAAVAEAVAGEVAKVFFSGGPEEGRRVAAACGARGRGAVLDLGGKDAQLVLADADLDHAVGGALWGGLAAAGQTGAAIERIYVVRAVAERFTAALERGARGLRVGDPLRWDTEVGPLASEAQRRHVMALVDDAVARGAVRHCGGPVEPAGLGGPFVAPIVLSGVTSEMELMRVPVRGPVLPVQAVDDEEEAVRLANGCAFGLGASVWTLDRGRGARIARRLECGMVWLNDHGYSYAGMQWPWGGAKASGAGRMNGRLGFDEAVNAKLLAWEPSRFRDGWWHPYDEALGRAVEATARLLYGRDDDKLDALRRGAGPIARVLSRVVGDSGPR